MITYCYEADSYEHTVLKIPVGAPCCGDDDEAKDKIYVKTVCYIRGTSWERSCDSSWEVAGPE